MNTAGTKDMTTGNPARLLLAFSMPLMLGNQKGIDGSTCSAAIILTTLLCVLTIPVLLTLTG